MVSTRSHFNIINRYLVLAGIPFAFIGFSFGSLILYEVCAKLCQRSMKLPIHCWICSSLPPHYPNTHQFHKITDDREFLQEVCDVTGLSNILSQQHIWNSLLPGIRADFEAIERETVGEYRKRNQSSPTKFRAGIC